MGSQALCLATHFFTFMLYSLIEVKKMIRYEYEPGFCRQLHYNGLWRVQYEGLPGHFKKVKMACACMKDGCDQDCEVFGTVSEVKDQSMEWHMKDEKGDMVG